MMKLRLRVPFFWRLVGVEGVGVNGNGEEGRGAEGDGAGVNCVGGDGTGVNSEEKILEEGVEGRLLTLSERVVDVREANTILLMSSMLIRGW
jgi:hypothetical protein